MVGVSKTITICPHYEGLPQPPVHLRGLPSDVIVEVFCKNLFLGATLSVTLHFFLFFLLLTPAYFSSFWSLCCHESLSWKLSRCLYGNSRPWVDEKWGVLLRIIALNPGRISVFLPRNWEGFKLYLLPTVIQGNRTGKYWQMWRLHP